jgi:transposase
LVGIGAAPGDDRWKTEASTHQQRGNGYLRMLLIHGARTALPGLAKKDTPLGRWLKDLLARAHRNVVIVALANKLARITWAVLARDRQYVTVQAAGS